METQRARKGILRISTNASSVHSSRTWRRTAPVVVCGDHSTPCIKKGHSDDPVPLLVSGNVVKQDGQRKVH